jgi:hypothetical protein
VQTPHLLRQGRCDSKLHITADARGGPIGMLLSAGHRSDYPGATALLFSLTSAKILIADWGHDADWFR